MKIQTIEDQFDGTTFDPSSGSTRGTRTGTLDLQAFEKKGPLAWEPILRKWNEVELSTVMQTCFMS